MLKRMLYKCITKKDRNNAFEPFQGVNIAFIMRLGIYYNAYFDRIIMSLNKGKERHG